MARVFVAVWPSDEIVARLSELPRPDTPGVRWTRREQWHVTLRFLGEVADKGEVAARLRGLASPAVRAVVGPVSECFGPAVLCMPVSGLDAVAAEVIAATADIGQPPDARPFRGHLTLARARRGNVRRIAPLAMDGTWNVEGVTVVESQPGPGGSKYEILATVPLAAAGPSG